MATNARVDLVHRPVVELGLLRPGSGERYRRAIVRRIAT
jgi:hypothetical protein